MATYYSNEITANYTTRENPSGNFDVYGKFTLTAALEAGDVIQMCKVPRYCKVLSMELYCDDLDSGGTPSITLDVGDGGDADRFAEAITIAQTGGFMRGIQTEAGFGYRYTDAADTIDITVNAAPATGAETGDIVLALTLCMDN